MLYYVNLFPEIREVARQHGYAVAVHGSMTRDFDLVAFPWAEQVSPPAVLVEAVRERLGGTIVPIGTLGGKWDPEKQEYVEAIVSNPEIKPHGRLAWTINLGGRPYIDLSVWPPS